MRVSVGTILVGLATALACGDDARSGADAAVVDAAVGDALVDGAVADGAVDAAADAAPPPFVVTAVVVDGAAALEVRQASTVELTLRGTGLAAVAAIRAGALTAAITATADDEIRAALVVPHGAVPSRVALTVTAGAVTTEVTTLTVTPFVVAADGSDGGRGTFGAPLRLCTPGLTAAMASGDTVYLRAGTHRCAGALAIPRGVVVRGEGVATTAVQSDQAAFDGLVVDGAAGTTELRDLTLRPGGVAAALHVRAGDLVLADVAIAVADARADGIVLAGGGVATLSRLAVDGPRIGVTVRNATSAQMTDATISAAATALGVIGGRVDGRRITIPCCEDGVVAVAAKVGDPVAIAITDLRVTGTRRAVRIDGGRVELGNPQLDGDGVDGAIAGVLLRSGTLVVHNGRIAGWPVSVDLAGIPLLGTFLDAEVANAQIVGATALRLAGVGAPSRLHLRGTSITGTTAAVQIVSAASGSTLDLGTGADRGGNLLWSPGLALDDDRAIAGDPIDLRGTFLNDQPFAGTVVGPALAAPDYRVRAANTLRF